MRLRDTTLYTSMFRYDDHLLVNLHIWGQPASANPLLHLRRVDASGWFDNYAQSFDAVWAGARPWTPDQRGWPPMGRTEYYHDPDAAKANTLIPASNLLVV